MTGRCTAVYACVLAIACVAGEGDRLVREDDTIVGKSRHKNAVWLLTERQRLVMFSISDWTVQDVPVVGLDADEEVWGLAGDGDGGFWTLVGAKTMVRVRSDGQTGRRVHLGRPHVGIHDAVDGLLLQPIDLVPEQSVLRLAARPGVRGKTAGSLTPTMLGTRTETLIRHLVACGLSVSDYVPCWFNNDRQMHLIGPDGGDRVIDLGGMSASASRRLSSLALRGAVVDAQVGPGGTLWVLRRPSGTSTRFVITGYAADGAQTFQRPLIGDVRLLLDIDSTRALLLTRDGFPVEVALS